MMELDTKALQMKIAEKLHDADGCQPRPFEECTKREDYLAKASIVLAGIMPTLIKDIVIPLRKDEDQRIAQRIEAELVCCDITQRMEAEAAKGRWDDENHQYLMPQSWHDLRRSHDYHPICFYGGWAANIARDGIGRRYWCSSGGEFELNEGGGFQTCCDNPDGHIFMGPESEEDD